MPARLSYRFEPLADLYLLLTDPIRCPADGDWKPARDAMGRCVAELAAASGGPRRADMAFHGLIAEHRTIDELESAVPHLPDETVLGLPWARLTERAIEALRLAEAAYASVAEERAAVAREAIDNRVQTTLVPKERECLAFVQECLRLPDHDVDYPVVLTASAPFPGAFTSLSDTTGAICFVGVDGLDGTSLLETIVHEAIHALQITIGRGAGSMIGRLAKAVTDRFPDERSFGEVSHSLIFVQAAETIRRIIDPAHVHYGVSHTYYDRVPPSKCVLRHWVSQLDGEIDADTAIQRILADLERSG